MLIWTDEVTQVHGDERPARRVTAQGLIAGVLLVAGAFALATLVAGVLVSGVR